MSIRSSLAWRLAPALLAIEIAVLLSRGIPWLGEWAWSIDWTNGTAIVTGPVVAGLAAYDYDRYRGISYAEWSNSPRWGWLHPVPVAVGNATVGIGVHAGVLVGVLVANLAVGAGGTPSIAILLPTAVTFSMIAVCACLGVALAELVRTPLSAPLAAALLFGATIAGASQDSSLHVFRAGGVTGSLVGLTWSRAGAAVTLAAYGSGGHRPCCWPFCVDRRFGIARGWRTSPRSFSSSERWRSRPLPVPIAWLSTGRRAATRVRETRPRSASQRAPAGHCRRLRVSSTGSPDHWSRRALRSRPCFARSSPVRHRRRPMPHCSWSRRGSTPRLSRPSLSPTT